MRSLVGLLALGIWAGIAEPVAAGIDELVDAIERGDLAGVEQEVAAGADVNAAIKPFFATPLAIAAMRGETEIVAALLASGADTEKADYRGVTPISATVRSCAGKTDVLRALIDAGADMENRSGAQLTPVLAAVQSGRSDLAAFLLERGADVDAVNQFGDGVLNYAIYYRMPEIIQLAMDRNVSTDQLRLLFMNDQYYFPNFGADSLSLRRVQCGET